MDFKVESKRLLLLLILFFIGLVVLFYTNRADFLTLISKFMFGLLSIILAHISRKIIFYYIDLRKEVINLQAKKDYPASILIAKSLVVGLFYAAAIIAFALAF